MMIAIKTKFGHLAISLFFFSSKPFFLSPTTFFSHPYSVSPDTVARLVCTIHTLPLIMSSCKTNSTPRRIWGWCDYPLGAVQYQEPHSPEQTTERPWEPQRGLVICGRPWGSCWEGWSLRVACNFSGIRLVTDATMQPETVPIDASSSSFIINSIPFCTQCLGLDVVFGFAVATLANPDLETTGSSDPGASVHAWPWQWYWKWAVV